MTDATPDSQGAGIPAPERDFAIERFPELYVAPSPQTPAATGDGLAVVGYRINTGHGNHLTESMSADQAEFMWAGKPAWRALTYRDDAQAIIDRKSDAIQRLWRERDEARAALKVARPDTAAIMQKAYIYALAQSNGTREELEAAREALRRALDGEQAA